MDRIKKRNVRLKPDVSFFETVIELFIRFVEVDQTICRTIVV